MNDTPLEIRLFGHFAATVRGEPLPPLRTRKGHWLLGLLALRQGREVSREWLAGTLWADSAHEQAYYNLRQCLTNLRRALGDAADCLISPTPQTLCLTADAVWCDVAEYDALLVEGSPSSLKQAVALYRGPLMEGCAEEYFAEQRTAYEQSFLATLETLAQDALQQGASSEAVRYLRRLLSADPFREAACRALMEALAECGDDAAVRQVYRELRRLLHCELNTVPAPETDALYRRLVEQAKQPVSSVSSPSTGYAVRRRNLPIPITRLIGREQEIEEAIAALRKDRLVTLTGAGGIGKSRLALAVGERLIGDYQDGVWFVELAALSDPERVPQTILKTLGITEQAGQLAVETLRRTLSKRTTLIILDNAEHLIEACAALTDRLLVSCCGVSLLVTSRQPLNLTGEQVYRVPPLSLPPEKAEANCSVSHLLNYAGVQLFVERGAQWKPDFRLTQQNAEAILQICYRLDGIPLALELAAARMRSLSPQEINTALQDRFALLVGGSRTALPRHRTLRALIDWSCDLLSEAERQLLWSLSVFAGGWTVAHAQQISAGDRNSLLEGLTSLVDQSLMIADTQNSVTRYHLLETVRQYAAEKLRESGRADAISRRHALCFLAVAEEADSCSRRDDRGRWMTLLETENPNLRAALAWSRLSDETEIEARLVTALYTFWHLRGYSQEGREALLEAAAKAGKRCQLALQAGLLLKAGALARLQGEDDLAEMALTESLTLAQRIGDQEVEASSLILLGSLALCRNDDATGVALLELAMQTAVHIGDRAAQSECLVWLGDAARWRGDYVAAQRFYEEGAAAARPLGMGWFEACAVGMQAETALLQGEVEIASELARRALQGYMAVGDKTYCLLILDTFAGIALERADPIRAASLLGGIDALTKALNIPLPLPEQEKHQKRLDTARSALDAAEFDRAYLDGHRFQWEQMIAYALEDNSVLTNF